MLDRIDVALVRALQKDARQSNKELANSVGLAPSTTHGRIVRLANDNVIQGFHARVDADAVGIGLQAMVFLRMATHGVEVLGTPWSTLIEREEVATAWYLGGEDDVVLHVAVRNTRHLQDFITHVLGGMKTIARVRTEIVFEHHLAQLPVYTDSDTGET
jgi:DNA-binding Lrp family transcriptional regulator